MAPDRSWSIGSRLRVLIVLGHPRADSLSGALARAYRAGAVAAGVEVRELRLAELDFEPDVTAAAILTQTLEPDLCRAQALIAWADHLVFVYPTWWGTMPAGSRRFSTASCCRVTPLPGEPTARVSCRCSAAARPS